MISNRFSRAGAGAVTGALAVAGSLFVAAGPAQAATCAAPVRYTPTTNTIYLSGGAHTLSKIIAACPDAPLKRLDAKSRTWLLSADLVLQQGATLTLKGGKAGDVDNLRIRSLASNKATEVQQITASYGTIAIDSVKITSWDTAKNAPDTNATLPADMQATGRGRAFIRALSTMAADGRTAQESRMTIRNSTLSNLGYYGGEAYGVAYKARGCDRDHLAVCKKLKVSGEQINSVFDRNYMGTYTWGAKGITFRGNTYSNNIAYGLDPHDVSTNLTIDRNRFTYNGNHGVICSQLCDKLTITNNTSDHNGTRPSDPVIAGDAADESDGEVHGIMLHRGVTNSKITGNTVTDQTRGAGIAIFDSTKNTVSGNKLTNNKFGIRLTVGSANNTVKDNTITASPANAILVFPGTDKATYSTLSGRPTNNTFTNNTIIGTGSNGIRLVDADKNTITGKSMTKLGGALQFVRSTGNTLSKVSLPARQPISVIGSPAIRSTLTLGVAPTAVAVTTDQYSKVNYR